MPNIHEYYEYAKLATAAYVGMEGTPSIDGANLALRANAQSRLPIALANKTFDKNSEEALSSSENVWNLTGYFADDDPITGFAATLFERNGEKRIRVRLQLL